MGKYTLVIFFLGLYASNAIALDICETQLDGTRLAHPLDCSKFVICQRELTDAIASCPNGLHFNRHLGECDLKARAGCEIANTEPALANDCSNSTNCSEDCCCSCCNCGCTTPTPTPAPTPASPTPASPTPSPTPSGSTPATPSTIGPETGPSGITCVQSGLCENMPEGTRKSNPSTNGYIVCICECEVPMPCPDGLLFNESIGVCDWPASSGIAASSIICPGDLVFNAITGMCDWPSGYNPDIGNVNVTCSNNATICKGEPEGTLYQVEGVCNAFYKCNFGCAVEIICPYNLIYNPNALMCDQRQNYNCPWPYTPPSGPNAGPSGISCPSGGRCVDEMDGTMLPSTTDCNKYVVCQCACEVELVCPAGLVWDTDLQTCNYKSNCTL